MANYSAIKAAVNAYIKQNGRKEITGRILNAVLNATIDSLGRYFQFAGGAMPTDDPGTPDQNVCYLAGEPGVYTNFGGITIENEEVALLFWNGEWSKQRILIGIQEVNASVDNQVGTPSVDVSYSGGQLVLTFHNIKGETGDSAGFGTIGADINGGVGTPGVSVETSGDNTAKNLMFHFTNLKGETGVTSVVATIDNTSGTPSCQVSLVNGVLTLAFSGLKGLKGDTGVSADYPITIYNGLDSDATDQALAAAQGKVLDGKIDRLDHILTGADVETEQSPTYIPCRYVLPSGQMSPLAEGTTYAYCDPILIPEDVSTIKVRGVLNSPSFGGVFFSKTATVPISSAQVTSRVVRAFANTASSSGNVNDELVIDSATLNELRTLGANYIYVGVYQSGNKEMVFVSRSGAGLISDVNALQERVGVIDGEILTINNEIDSIEGELNDRQEESTIYDSANGIYMENNGFISQSGSISFTDQDTYQYSNPVDLDGVLSLDVKALFSNPYGGGVAFYTEAGTFISSIYNTGGTGNSVKIIDRADFPDNAASCRVIIQKPSSGAGAYYLKVTKYVQGVISTLEDVKESLDNLVIPNVEYDIMNYALFINKYISGKEYVNGVLVDNSSMISTNMMVLDVDHDIAIGTRTDASAVFFDGDGNYLSTIQGKLASAISAASFPAGAKYIAFSYASTSLYNGEFFTLRKYDPNFGQRASHTLKIKGTRPRIDIYLSDSESAILLKLVEAWLTEDCDVYWECGEYAFSSVYQYMRDNGIGTYRGTYELPIGGNCKYYFQNSTITGNPTSGLTDTKVFGNMRCGGCNFELHDGTIMANGLTYCVHDEGQGQPEAYVHKYHNMRIIYKTGENTSSISKCIGGGMGLRGECVIDGCTTISDNDLSYADISWHGVSGTHDPCVFKLFMTNNHVSKGIEMSTIPTGDIAYYICCGNSFGASPTFGTRWSGRSFNNEVR